MVKSVKKQIANMIKDSMDKAFDGNVKFMPEIIVEIPREKQYGDFSTNAAMQTAKDMCKSPRQVAEILIQNMDRKGTYVKDITCAGPGFINFRLNDEWFYDTLRAVSTQRDRYGRFDSGDGRKVMVEFVSANPTGPLHMGNARGGALGDCIASVLEASGYKVTREFYINDAGGQIEKFGISLEARYIQELKGEDVVEFPEDGYAGEDIRSHARDFISMYGDELLELTPEERRTRLVEFALPRNLDSIKEGLKKYGIEFDVWFSERELHESGELQETIQYLKEKGYTYEKDGAVWFRASWFGTDKDEVIVRSNGVPTYFAADMAYHRNKFLKRGFDRVINLLGADHHGHAARMKAAVKAFGIAPAKLNIIIFQLVRLLRNGEVARMSKRTGKAITLDDLVEETGRDAARFFFNMKASGNHLDFDLDLAVEKSSDNPVYYVQYAHARICSMLKVLEADGVRVLPASEADLRLLVTEEETGLIRKLAEYPEEVRISADTLEPARLTRYVQDVASQFHSFYNTCRVKGEKEDLLKARLVLVDCTRIVLENALGLLKIDAPESM